MVTDQASVVVGQASVRLANWGTLSTIPAAVPLGPNTTYLVELQYKILSTGSDQGALSQLAAKAKSVPRPPGRSRITAASPSVATQSTGYN